MALLVLAFLDLAEPDLGRIEQLRRLHDRQHTLVAAHFTLAFPFDSLGVGAAAAHIRPIAARTRPIAFRLNAAIAVRDALSPRSHVFLTPEQGGAEIAALHDDLYVGALADQRRLDISFVPHVTVADFADHDAAKVLARDINADGLDITGRIGAVDLIDYDGVAVKTIRSFLLGDGT